MIGIANSLVRAEMAMNNGADATFLYSDPDLQQKIAGQSCSPPPAGSADSTPPFAAELWWARFH